MINVAIYWPEIAAMAAIPHHANREITVIATAVAKGDVEISSGGSWVNHNLCQPAKIALNNNGIAEVLGTAEIFPPPLS
jgi:hypothetical protein